MSSSQGPAWAGGSGSADDPFTLSSSRPPIRTQSPTPLGHPFGMGDFAYTDPVSRRYYRILHANGNCLTVANDSGDLYLTNRDLGDKYMIWLCDDDAGWATFRNQGNNNYLRHDPFGSQVTLTAHIANTATQEKWFVLTKSDTGVAAANVLKFMHVHQLAELGHRVESYQLWTVGLEPGDSGGIVGSLHNPQAAWWFEEVDANNVKALLATPIPPEPSRLSLPFRPSKTPKKSEKPEDSNLGVFSNHDDHPVSQSFLESLGYPKSR